MLEEQAIAARSLLAKANELGLDGVKVEIMQRHLFDKGAMRVDSRIQATGKGDFDKVQQLKGQLEGKEAEIALGIDTSPAIGDKCPTLELVKTSDGTSLTHEFAPEKVYLLDFWATWCGPCQGPMQHNQDMLNANPDWEGKVDIVAISLDDSTAEPKQRLEERSWNKVSSYWASGGFESAAAQRFAVEGIPFCVLVHGGNILWKGHPSELDLAKSINGLLAGQPLELPPAAPQAGDACPSIDCKVIADQSAKVLEFTEADPKVYLVDFWATWCGPCQGPMQHNQEMLEAHPEWEGHAEILGISLDQKLEELTKRIADRGWTKVTHYWGGPLGFKENAPKAFAVDGIPCCLLVHKGKILWRGHPSERKLDADISSLIRGEGLVESAAAAQQQIPLAEFNQKIERLTALHNSFKEEHASISFPVFICFPTRNVEFGKEESETYRLIVTGEYRERQKATLQPVIDAIKEMFPTLDERIEYVPGQREIQRAESCSLCNKVLTPQDTQFICLFCDPQHAHCAECHNAPREGTGSARLAHPHSVYKVTALSTGLDDLRFGSTNQRLNAVLAEDPPSRVHRGVGCDNRYGDGGCTSNGVEGIRWKCAHCPDYDFCETCEGVWGENAPEAMKNVAKSRGHELWHVMFAIPFPS